MKPLLWSFLEHLDVFSPLKKSKIIPSIQTKTSMMRLMIHDPLPSDLNRSWTKAWGYECPKLYVGVSPRWPVENTLCGNTPSPKTNIYGTWKSTWKFTHLWRNIYKSAILGFHVPFFGGVSLYKVGCCVVEPSKIITKHVDAQCAVNFCGNVRNRERGRPKPQIPRLFSRDFLLVTEGLKLFDMIFKDL